jgi:hypothetical protein
MVVPMFTLGRKLDQFSEDGSRPEPFGQIPLGREMILVRLPQHLSTGPHSFWAINAILNRE